MSYIEETVDTSLLGVLADLEPLGSATTIDLGELWRELCTGTTRIAATVSTNRRSYFKLVPNEATSRAARVPVRYQHVLERLLLGETQKMVAFDSSRSTSTVAISARRCLRAWGLHCRCSNTPALLIMALHAYRGRTELRQGFLNVVEREGMKYRILSAPRFDDCLQGLLSPGECEVARLRVDGRSLEEIGSVCKKSVRTVANQIASAYRKLDVSGRMELVCRLLEGAKFEPPRQPVESTPPEAG